MAILEIRKLDPGEEPYLNLESYFTSVLEHMKDI